MYVLEVDTEAWKRLAQLKRAVVLVMVGAGIPPAVLSL